MSDRVAEALAILEAAEKEAEPGPWRRDMNGMVADARHVGVAGTFEDAEFIAKARNAAPALLRLAKLWTEPAPYGRQLTALNELADAVLGPAPTPEEHRAP